MGDLRIRLRLDGSGAREASPSPAAAAAASPAAASEGDEEVEQELAKALRVGFMKRGTLPGTYRTYHGHPYDQVTSALHKSGVRRELTEQSEYHLFECLLFLELGPDSSKHIITNLLNRLKVMLVEDTLAFLTARVSVAILDDLQRFEGAGRTFKAAFYVHRAFGFLSAGTIKCRVPSDLRAFYYDLPRVQLAKPEVVVLEKRRARYQQQQILLSPSELSRLLFSKQQPGDDPKAVIDVALFSMCLERKDPSCFYFAFQLLIDTKQYASSGTHSFLDPSPSHKAATIKRKTVDFLLWKVLESFIQSRSTVNIGLVRDANTVSPTSKVPLVHRTTALHLRFCRYMRQLYIQLHDHREAYMCLVQAVMVYLHGPEVVDDIDQETFDQYSSAVTLAELDAHRHAKKRDIAAVEPYAIDMHTAAGRKAGKNRIDFAEEGALLTPDAAKFANYSRPDWHEAFVEFKKYQVANPLKRKRKDEGEQQDGPKEKKGKKKKKDKKRKAESESEEPAAKKPRKEANWLGEENSDFDETAAAAAAKKKPASKMSKLRQQAGKQRAFMAQQTSVRQKISAAMVAPAPAVAAAASARAVAAAAVQAMKVALAEQKESKKKKKESKKLRLHFGDDHPLRPRVLLDRRVTVHDLQLLKYPYYDSKEPLPIWYCSVKHKKREDRVLRLVVQARPTDSNAPIIEIDRIKTALGLVNGHSTLWRDPKHPEIEWLIRRDRGNRLLKAGRYPTEKDSHRTKVAAQTGMQSLASFLKSSDCPKSSATDLFWRSLWSVLMWRWALGCANTDIETIMVLTSGPSRFYAYSFDESRLIATDFDPQFEQPGIKQLFAVSPPSEFLADLNMARPTKYLRDLLVEWSKILSARDSSLSLVLAARCRRAGIQLSKSAFRLI